MKRLIILSLLFLSFFLLSSCDRIGEYKKSFIYFQTEIEVTIYSNNKSDAEQMIKYAKTLFELYNNLTDRYRDYKDTIGIYYINSHKDEEITICDELYDLIILDPPTFSNSKNTNDVLDINRDWPQLVKDCLNILNPGGKLYFSTNSERIKFDITKIPTKTAADFEFTYKEITAQTIPNDFEGKKPHSVWEFNLSR